MNPSPWRRIADRPQVWVLGAVLLVAALLRVAAIDRQGLSADEIFSIAMATGHSLEHEAAVADSARGDFIEREEPVAAAVYGDYLRHDHPAAGPARVVRAVRMSDTSPPAYYLALNLWTRVTGTGDVLARIPSLLFALASLPLIWAIAVRIGGARAAAVATLLFAISPVAVRYSIEVRMYAMIWLLVLLAAWLALKIQAGEGGRRIVAVWALVSALGMLTHYFFVFPWLAIGAWLLLVPGDGDRRVVAGAMAGALVLVLPWYIHIPEMLAQWRVTSGWLEEAPPRYRHLKAPLELGWSFFSSDPWSPRAQPGRLRLVLTLAAVLGAVALIDWRGRWRRVALIALWLAAACAGPVAFDLVQGTFAGAIARYALAGLPAAFIAVGVAVSSRWRPVLAPVVVVAAAGLWAGGIRAIYAPRTDAPVRTLARQVGAMASENDLVIVQSIPSGVVGAARYYDGKAPMASWVSRLGGREVPADVDRLVAGRSRVYLVRAHVFGSRSDLERHLRRSARVLDEQGRSTAGYIVFAPHSGGSSAVMDTAGPGGTDAQR